jgi:phage terminase Nu1 subunit (DNA packaging protein)
MPTVTVTRVASFLNLTQSRVAQLVKEGMPKETRGQYDPIKCAVWYIRDLQTAIERRTTPTLDEGSAAERGTRVRLLRADADLRELELAKQRNHIVTVADANKTITELVVVTTGYLRAL